jgi:hypothetical protein
MGNSDSGHLGNLTGFNQLINSVKGYPQKYNPSTKQNSVSQLSFDERLNNFYKYILQLELVPK